MDNEIVKEVVDYKFEDKAPDYYFMCLSSDRHAYKDPRWVNPPYPPGELPRVGQRFTLEVTSIDVSPSGHVTCYLGLAPVGDNHG